MAISVCAAEKSFNPAILIPVYNHQKAIESTLEKVLFFNVDVMLVNDGSDDACRLILQKLQQENASRVHLIELSVNSGKGGALKAGFRELHKLGYSHALQVDADGQHDLDKVTLFLNTAQKREDALIVGYPEYDKSVPKLRFYGRYLTHVWIWINTLSLSIEDSMCGFRVYPLAKITHQIDSEYSGDRMDFDPEILVRWLWNGNEIINLPTRVHYPEDGVSHFLVWRDNLLISWMHTRLFFGMLVRFPVLIRRKFYD